MTSVSIIMPAIRTNSWDKMYDSMVLSCKRYEWELILCGPFPLTPYLQSKNNVKYIQDYGAPTRCLQLCLFEVEKELIYHTTDDAILFENAIDEAIDLYKEKCGYKDVINMRYREDINYSGKSMDINYWRAYFHGCLRLAGIPSTYKISLHHLMNTEYLREMGGYDCRWHHANFSLHDLMFRVQYDGGIIYDSINDITSCNHFPGQSGDHKAIHDAHVEEDAPLFTKIYSNPNVLNTNNKIDINNWTNADTIWHRRFKQKIPKEYKELLENE